ncbi:hypothetical protein FQA47_011843 [Oryzias melastigma]|uniref:Uncharacterized protein n=1 Tax=Oryzias melastigma TaxID=30732 RepID=A0A834CKY3_ORYME|nr:hypothetical protein FQA47_011843 [Oryzias melastigma]
MNDLESQTRLRPLLVWLAALTPLVDLMMSTVASTWSPSDVDSIRTMVLVSRRSGTWSSQDTSRRHKEDPELMPVWSGISHQI